MVARAGWWARPHHGQGQGPARTMDGFPGRLAPVGATPRGCPNGLVDGPHHGQAQGPAPTMCLVISAIMAVLVNANRSGQPFDIG